MKKKSKNKEKKAINSNALAYLKSLISPSVTVDDLEVKGKWLCASLSSGCTFSVRNQSVD